MEIDTNKIKEYLTNKNKKSLEVDLANESFFLGNETVQSIMSNKDKEDELRSILKENGLSLSVQRTKNSLSIKYSTETAKRSGYELILEKSNHGNFEEVKRRAKEIDRENVGLQLSENGWIVKLNKHNSDLVEQMVTENDTYSFPFAKYVFKGICSENGGVFPRNNYKYAEAMIRAIDRDNSTQVWQHDKDRIKKMAKYLSTPANGFWDDLLRHEDTLVDKLMNDSRVEPDDSDLVSLSSKICKYLLEYENGNKDSYFISDRFVRRALPFYCDEYDIEVEGLKLNTSFFNKYSYKQLFDVLEKLQKAANGDKTADDSDYLTKHMIDHILWFCYRSGTEVEEKKRQENNVQN